jgi:hypothetical protein
VSGRSVVISAPRYAPSSRLARRPILLATPLYQSRTWCTSASSHKWEAYRRRRFGRFSRRERRSYLEFVREKRATRKIGQSAIGPPGWLEKGSSASLLVRYVPHQFDGCRGKPDRHKGKTGAGCSSLTHSAPSPKSLGFRCVQNGSSARREEGAYLDRYVTDEQRSSRPIFNATLRAAASWLFFRVARSTVMMQIAALRSRLEKQPTDLRRNPRDLGDGALTSKPF